MWLVFFKSSPLGAIQLDDLTINPHPNESFAFNLFDDIPEFAWFVFDQRCEHDDFRAWLIAENLIDNLLGGLAVQWPASEWIVRLTDRREEKAQIIINFGRSCDRRSWIGAGVALLDCDSRREPFNEVDIRLFQPIEKLPGVSGEALHVTPLPFSVKGIKGERRLSRAT